MIKVLKNKHLKKIISSVVLVFLLSLVFAVPASAQEKLPNIPECKFKKDDIRLQVYLPMDAVKTCQKETYVMNDSGMFIKVWRKVYYIESLQAYISGIYTLSIGVLSLGAIVVIMLGGFQYVWAAGNQQKISSAKSMISGALGGLVLALLSYALLNTINPEIKSLQIKDVGPIREITRVMYCREVVEAYDPPGCQPPGGTPPPPICTSYPKIFASYPEGDDPVEDYSLTLLETKCGYPFYIKAGAGNSCFGLVCPTGKICANGNCFKGSIHGSIGFDDSERHVVSIGLLGICKRNGVMREFDATDRVEIYNPELPGQYVIPDDFELSDCDDISSARYEISIEVNEPCFMCINEYYRVAPPTGEKECNQPLKLCANEQKAQKPPLSDGTCPEGYPIEVIRSLRMDKNVHYNHLYLWTHSQIVNSEVEKQCNIFINDSFPVNYGEE